MGCLSPRGSAAGSGEPVLEEDVDAEKLLYLLVLSFILDEIGIMFPHTQLDPGSKARQLAERIAARIVIEADQETFL